MKVVLAPDKFAGTLSAAEAAAALARGWTRARPGDELVAVPMADGGEGTLAVVAAGVAGAQRVEVEVADALGRPRMATWLRLPDGTALIEAAEACGLSRLAAGERDPLRTTSYGVGQLLRAAADAGATPLVVGLGGSASVDGGAGLAIALGAVLRRADGNRLRVGGRSVGELVSAEPAAPLGAPVVLAGDVTNPLLGPAGAARVFGPQKGATPEVVELLEAALTVFADVLERDLPGGPWRGVPGAGAAGGLGFALLALTGARIVPGAAAVADLLGLERALEGAGVAVTGEGSLDASSAGGKAPLHVLARGRAHGARVLAVAGRVRDGAGDAFDDHRDLGPEGLSRAADLVEERAADLAAALAPEPWR